MAEAAGVLLVHGAWFTSKMWDGVAAGLRDAGVRVAVTELHRGSLEADTQAARAALDTLGGPAVVCGHSYGGAVITGLPPEQISHLVYLAATMLDTGEAALGLIQNEPSALHEAIRPADVEGVTVLDPVLAGPGLAGTLSAAEQAEIVRELRPQQMAAGFQSPSSIAWRTRPSTYVICTEDKAIPAVVQERLAQRATSVLKWPSDHAVFRSHETETVDLLRLLASR